MTAVASRIRLRLFVEGVELPCISCQVESAPNGPMVASIQIPPLTEATRFLPRSLVHVFFYDDYERAEDSTLTMTGDSVRGAPGYSNVEKATNRALETWDNDPDGSNKLLQIERGLNQYKLFFVGELMGFSWTKNPTNRSIVLQCADLSNYWEHAFQFNNSDIFGPGMKAMFSGGATNLFTDFLEEPGGAVVRIILSASERYPQLQGLLGGIIHLLESMGGSYYHNKKFAGQNIFFSIAELRLHITQLLTAYDKDPTAKKLLGGGYDALFGRSIGNLGEQASFRQIINMLAGVIFHETYGQPCPRYVPGSQGSITGFSRKKIGGIKDKQGRAPFAGPVQNAKDLVVSLDEIIDRMAGYASGVPASGDVKETAKYRLDHVTTSMTQIAGVQKACSKNAQVAASEAPTAKKLGVPSIAAAANEAAGYFRQAASECGKALALLKPTAYTPKTTGNKVIETLKNAIKYLEKIPNIEANVTKPSKAIPAALNQQIFRPDVWFSAPPRCNVIFPEQYSSLNYSRNFMQEPTRLLLKTNDEFFGEDELFDNFYFAPKSITTKQEKNTLQAILRGDILDHELFTGILPVFEKMGEFNIFAARSGQVDGKTPKIGLAQRSTNFLYFKYRFAARQLQISGRFNPYIAVGFPGLIIDKYVDLDQYKAHVELLHSPAMQNSFGKGGLSMQDIMPIMGTHFLANFTEVSHSIDQQQGVTNINCSYARQPDESVEFLGNVQDEIDVLRKQPGTATRVTTVASIYAPRTDSQGPAFGRIIEVKETTSRDKAPVTTGPNQKEHFNAAKRLPLFGGPRDPKTKQLKVTVPVGFISYASNYGPEVVELVGDPDMLVMFKSFDVTEEISKNRTEKVDLPPEEYIRPGWYGDCWHPSKISDVYYDFFNTGAITEPMQVSNLIGFDSSQPKHHTSDAGAELADMMSDKAPLKYAQDQLITLALTKESNIQQAVAFLVLTYSIIKQAGFSANDFIRTYTWRPIATMLDLFGSSDLELDLDGNQVVSGIEGFHSRAFGPYEDLFGLVTSDIESVVGVKRGTVQSQRADTRKRKFMAVIAYAAQLRISKAILG